MALNVDLRSQVTGITVCGVGLNDTSIRCLEPGSLIHTRELACREIIQFDVEYVEY